MSNIGKIKYRSTLIKAVICLLILCFSSFDVVYSYADTETALLENPELINDGSQSKVNSVATGKEEAGSSRNDLLFEILSDYQTSAFLISNSSDEQKNKNDKIVCLSEMTVRRLSEEGFYAMAVSSDNYDLTQFMLQTDLEKMGIRRDSHYIIVLDKEPGDAEFISTDSNIKASHTPQFSYSYNGSSYTLRYMIITAADDPLMGKASTVNLLNSYGYQVIMNCLDAAVEAYLNAVCSGLGTVSSILGLSINNINTSHTMTLNLNCGTNWTRVYTQVWSNYDNAWFNGAFVEQVNANAYMSGMYYSAQTNSYQAVSQNPVSASRNSTYFGNTTWRCEKGVLGYLYGYSYTDTVGDVKYRYNGQVKVTHYENF